MAAWVAFFTSEELKITKPVLLLLIDTIIVLLQFIVYKKTMEETEKPPVKSWVSFKLFEVLVGSKDKSKGQINSDTQNFVDEPLVFQADIYSLAYAALLNPSDKYWDDNKDTVGHIPKLKMLNSERDSLFEGAICVAFM